MIHTIITPNKQNVSFDIPIHYIGKQIEIIAFALDEGISYPQPVVKKPSFTVLHVNVKDYKFNRDEANER